MRYAMPISRKKMISLDDTKHEESAHQRLILKSFLGRLALAVKRGQAHERK